MICDKNCRAQGLCAALKLTKLEVIEYIENFLNDKGKIYDWDDFTSIKIDDEFLDWIRYECADCDSRYPSGSKTEYCSDAGAEYMRSLVERVREYNENSE